MAYHHDPMSSVFTSQTSGMSSSSTTSIAAQHFLDISVGYDFRAMWDIDFLRVAEDLGGLLDEESADRMMVVLLMPIKPQGVDTAVAQYQRALNSASSHQQRSMLFATLHYWKTKSLQPCFGVDIFEAVNEDLPGVAARCRAVLGLEVTSRTDLRYLTQLTPPPTAGVATAQGSQHWGSSSNATASTAATLRNASESSASPHLPPPSSRQPRPRPGSCLNIADVNTQLQAAMNCIGLLDRVCQGERSGWVQHPCLWDGGNPGNQRLTHTLQQLVDCSQTLLSHMTCNQQAQRYHDEVQAAQGSGGGGAGVGQRPGLDGSQPLPPPYAFHAQPESVHGGIVSGVAQPETRRYGMGEASRAASAYANTATGGGQREHAAATTTTAGPEQRYSQRAPAASARHDTDITVRGLTESVQHMDFSSHSPSPRQRPPPVNTQARAASADPGDDSLSDLAVMGAAALAALPDFHEDLPDAAATLPMCVNDPSVTSRVLIGGNAIILQSIEGLDRERKECIQGHGIDFRRISTGEVKQIAEDLEHHLTTDQQHQLANTLMRQINISTGAVDVIEGKRAGDCTTDQHRGWSFLAVLLDVWGPNVLDTHATGKVVFQAVHAISEEAATYCAAVLKFPPTSSPTSRT